jgi:hypothetical protein
MRSSYPLWKNNFLRAMKWVIEESKRYSLKAYGKPYRPNVFQPKVGDNPDQALFYALTLGEKPFDAGSFFPERPELSAEAVLVAFEWWLLNGQDGGPVVGGEDGVRFARAKLLEHSEWDGSPFTYIRNNFVPDPKRRRP